MEMDSKGQVTAVTKATCGVISEPAIDFLKPLTEAIVGEMQTLNLTTDPQVPSSGSCKGLNVDLEPTSTVVSSHATATLAQTVTGSLASDRRGAGRVTSLRRRLQGHMAALRHHLRPADPRRVC
jgi:hypothetical protein